MPQILHQDGQDLESLQGRVQFRLRGQIRQLELSYEGKGLILRGQTSTYYFKQLAQHAVMELTELPIWINAIEVIDPRSTDMLAW